jgi:hypothetical protein
MHKVLNGAMTQIAKPTGLLSVTTMNQLCITGRFRSVVAGSWSVPEDGIESRNLYDMRDSS